jgi:2-oxoisovalerate dehydrogenase E2 component (dihydrolipoyl transacylase)
MAQTMTVSTKIPHFGYCDEVKMDNLMQLRERLKNKVEQRGVKLTYLPFIIKATSLALKEFPIINSSINESLTEITIKVPISFIFSIQFNSIQFNSIHLQTK